MHFDENTLLGEILETCPWLPEALAESDERARPFLAMMNTPLGRRALREATVADAAKYLHRTPERLLEKLELVLRAHGEN